jgi:hypothetical protein
MTTVIEVASERDTALNLAAREEYMLMTTLL